MSIDPNSPIRPLSSSAIKILDDKIDKLILSFDKSHNSFKDVAHCLSQALRILATGSAYYLELEELEALWRNHHNVYNNLLSTFLLSADTVSGIICHFHDNIQPFILPTCEMSIDEKKETLCEFKETLDLKWKENKKDIGHCLEDLRVDVSTFTSRYSLLLSKIGAKDSKLKQKFEDLLLRAKIQVATVSVEVLCKLVRNSRAFFRFIGIILPGDDWTSCTMEAPFITMVSSSIVKVLAVIADGTKKRDENQQIQALRLGESEVEVAAISEKMDALSEVWAQFGISVESLAQALNTAQGPTQDMVVTQSCNTIIYLCRALNDTLTKLRTELSKPQYAVDAPPPYKSQPSPRPADCKAEKVV
ncbi:hypothetical protein HYPSUDRAFT_37514 [Hypholoma sublateritium FD-334 SS-4]|uniref:Uncharacterized protein n=1 Tax=Hypholoma sublateritium (strain FD-334 SS-4) TaxID=945553 RepID=A0A0D2P3Q1_HYPSF|nr:hypothetical protein HYPSUDRAFT_37514 [Hypholoma sublateritium FD-334 SS-4]